MVNAKEEFIEDTKELKVICASLKFDEGEDINLKVGYNENDYNIFLSKLDKRYDSGYGGQELYGIVWCENGIWLSRGEYDGSEWWEENQYPEIYDMLSK